MDDLATPPAVPRPLTRRAAWAAWTEPSVRLWWLLAGAVAVAVVGLMVQRLWARQGESRLIATGAAVAARVVSSGDHATPGQMADAGRPAMVEFGWHGQPIRTVNVLTATSTVGATVPVRVDPTDPTLWTDRTAPTSVADAVGVGLALLVTLVPLVMSIAVFKRRARVRAWRLGGAVEAVVADRRQVPIAPLSYAVRCSLRDAADRRLRTVYVPPAGRSLAKGDALWVLVPPGRGRAVAAMWFWPGEALDHGDAEARRAVGAEELP